MPLQFFVRIFTGMALSCFWRNMVLCEPVESPQNCVKLWNFFCTPVFFQIYQHLFR